MIRKTKIPNKKTIAAFNEDLSNAKRYKNVNEMFKEKKKTQKEILIENAEDVLDMLRDAKSYDDIHKKYGVRREVISWFIAESDYSTRAHEARKESSEAILEKALNCILEIDSSDTNAKVTRQKELAYHYRWLASKKNPRTFGEASVLKIDSDKELQPILNLTLNK